LCSTREDCKETEARQLNFHLIVFDPRWTFYCLLNEIVDERDGKCFLKDESMRELGISMRFQVNVRNIFFKFHPRCADCIYFSLESLKHTLKFWSFIYLHSLWIANLKQKKNISVHMLNISGFLNVFFYVRTWSDVNLRFVLGSVCEIRRV
jgi:hypothetical protein